MSVGKKLKAKLGDFGVPATLCVITVLMLMAIEFRHPYFFLQDDNRVYNLPAFVHNFRALTGGEFPLFNFHQYLGTPVSVQANALYPINYIATGLSALLLGNFFGTMEFIALIHLIMAALGFFYLMRHFELEEACCCFGAIAWTFCSFVITVGNSWIQILGYAAYLPWILLFSLKQIAGYDTRDFIILVFLRVCALFVGNPQFFLYTVMFDCMTVMLLYAVIKKSEKKSSPLRSAQAGFPRFLVRYAGNYLPVFLISLPLILPTFQEAAASAGRKQALSWDDYSAFGYNLKYWLNGLFTPFIDAGFDSWADQHFISHIGYLTIIGIVIALLSVRNYKNRGHVLVFSLLAVISFLWACNIVITGIFYHVSVFNRFTLPFKLAFFTSFYLVVLSTFGASIFYSKIRDITWSGHRIAPIAFVVIMVFHVANFLALHAVLPQHMFSRHLDKVPFDEPLKGTLANGRIVSAGLDVVWDGEKVLPGYSAPLLGYNYASLWGLYHFGGYGALISEKNLNAALGVKNSSVFEVAPGASLDFRSDVPLEYFRKWGVKWYVVDKRVPLIMGENLSVFSSDTQRNVVYDRAAKPFVFWSDGKNSSDVQYDFRTNSMNVTTGRETDGDLILNVLYNPSFVGSLDERTLPITETDDARMLVTVPKGRHSLVVTYVDNYFVYGSVISLAVTALLVIFYGMSIVPADKKRQRENLDRPAERDF